jgi:hypothetical protein
LPAFLKHTWKKVAVVMSFPSSPLSSVEQPFLSESLLRFAAPSALEEIMVDSEKIEALPHGVVDKIVDRFRMEIIGVSFLSADLILPSGRIDLFCLRLFHFFSSPCQFSYG